MKLHKKYSAPRRSDVNEKLLRLRKIYSARAITTPTCTVSISKERKQFGRVNVSRIHQEFGVVVEQYGYHFRGTKKSKIDDDGNMFASNKKGGWKFSTITIHNIPGDAFEIVKAAVEEKDFEVINIQHFLDKEELYKNIEPKSPITISKQGLKTAIGNPEFIRHLPLLMYLLDYSKRNSKWAEDEFIFQEVNGGNSDREYGKIICFQNLPKLLRAELTPTHLEIDGVAAKSRWYARQFEKHNISISEEIKNILINPDIYLYPELAKVGICKDEGKRLFQAALNGSNPSAWATPYSSISFAREHNREYSGRFVQNLFQPLVKPSNQLYKKLRADKSEKKGRVLTRAYFQEEKLEIRNKLRTNFGHLFGEVIPMHDALIVSLKSSSSSSPFYISEQLGTEFSIKSHRDRLAASKKL